MVAEVVGASWASAELRGADFSDERLNKRAVKLLERFGEKPSLSIPAACGGWSETQAAYRFFSNDKGFCCVSFLAAQRGYPDWCLRSQ